MSKKFLLLLIIFLVLLCACNLLILAANYPSFFGGKNHVAEFLKQKNTPSPGIINSLSLSPVNQIVVPGQPNTINVVLDSQGGSQETIPEIIQLEISYDPVALKDVSITPGDFFQRPTILLSLINPRTGRISYAIKAPFEKPRQTTGTVAIIKFTPNPTFSGKTTSVTFLPKTIMRVQTERKILTATYGTRLIFGASEQK